MDEESLLPGWAAAKRNICGPNAEWTKPNMPLVEDRPAPATAEELRAGLAEALNLLSQHMPRTGYSVAEKTVGRLRKLAER